MGGSDWVRVRYMKGKKISFREELKGLERMKGDIRVDMRGKRMERDRRLRWIERDRMIGYSSRLLEI